MGRFLLTQMAAVAELEAALIGERAKKALAAAKKRIARTGRLRCPAAAELRRAVCSLHW
jgi:DNA invertase Pin-like site-specific DNA recombinase